MFSPSRHMVAAALLVAATAATASCGNSDPGGSASGASSGNRAAGGGTPASPAAATASGASSGSSDARRQGVQFAACMREHGVDGFPDPDASGELTVDAVANGSAVDTQAPSWDAALEACKDLQPAGFTGRGRTAAQQRSALAFAQCVREHGVADFPDPPRDGALIDTNRIPSAAGRGALEIPGLQQALDTCSARYAGELGLKGP